MGSQKSKLLVLTFNVRNLMIYIFLKTNHTLGTLQNQKQLLFSWKAESKEKNKRIYIEVHFQRNASLSIKKEAAVLRLKRNGKNLETLEYAANLSLQFDQSGSVSNLTFNDLRNVLTGLNGCAKENSNVETQQLRSNSESSLESINKQPLFEYGDYVACVWYDYCLNRLRWYLVVADGMNNGELLISYYVQLKFKVLNLIKYFFDMSMFPTR